MSEELTIQFWRQHLATTTDSLIHFVSPGLLCLPDLSRAVDDLKFALFLVNTPPGSSAAMIMNGVARVMNFPDYFGSNWDALLDSLRDLSWITASGFVLVFPTADSFLSLENGEFSALVHVLEAATREWRDEPGEFEERPSALPFHVLFVGSDSLRQAIMSRLREPFCEHQTQVHFQVERTTGGVSRIRGFREAKDLLANGTSIRSILSFLRERSVSKFESIYILAALMQNSIPATKDLVNESRLWAADEDEADMRGRKTARDALRDLGE